MDRTTILPAAVVHSVEPGVEEAFLDNPLYREFSRLEEFARLPDESTIPRFRHRLDRHKPSEQTLATVPNEAVQKPSDPHP